MPEDKPSQTQEAPEEHHAKEPLEVAVVSRAPAPPMAILALIIIALLGVLLAVVWRGSLHGSGGHQADLSELEAEAKALRDQLNRERMAMGLRPLEGGSESVDQIAARLKKDADTMVALTGSLQSMLSEKDAEISAKNSELLRAEQVRQSLTAESARLQAELQRALVGSGEADLARRELASMKSQRDALAGELATMRNELAARGQGVSADDYAALERRCEEAQRAKGFLEARVAELESELSKARLFASSENELLPAAVELFRNLRKLEGKPDSEIATAYSSLGVSLGANVLHTLNFAAGSSGLAAADQEKIRLLIDEVPDGDLVLAIGYASETGNVDSNRELSSARATAAAEFYAGIKRPTQLVQAVYLGQTDRFSSRIPERNQIVELWRIRKKDAL